MNKICFSILATTSLLFANDINTKIENLPLFDKIDIKVNKAVDLGSLYLVSTEKDGRVEKIFVDKELKYAIVGTAFDTNTSKQLKLPVDVSLLNDSHFTYGEGKDEFYVFTDPECKYCQKLNEYLPKIKKDVSLNFYLFPLVQLHPKSKSISANILSSSDPLKSYLNKEFYTDENKYTKDAIKKVENSMSLGNTIDINSTPTIIDANGNKLNWVEFLNKFDINPKF